MWSSLFSIQLFAFLASKVKYYMFQLLDSFWSNLEDYRININF